ncbi:MAG: helix-turn-helix domain-containing protein [Bacteroidales bacterium]
MQELASQYNTLLVLLIAFQALIFGLIFFRTKRNGPEIILGYYETVYFIVYSAILLYYLNEHRLFIGAYYALIPLLALFPVLFYLYIKKIARGKLGKTELLHFIFPALLLITNFSFLPFLTFSEKWAVIIDQSVSSASHQQQIFLTINKSVYPLLLTMQPFVYIIFCGFEIWSLRKNIKDEYSYSKDINLQWSVQLIIAFTIIFIIALFVDNEQFNYAFILIINVLIGVSVVKHMQVETYAAESTGSMNLPGKKTEFHKYAASCLSEEEKTLLFEKLKTHLETKKRYNRPDLRLTDIANEISTNRQYLSQVINERTGENFYHFINRFRIEDFIQKVEMNPASNLSIEGVAFSVGFKSKSSFYSAFKKTKGCTPKVFFQKNN